ncbi:hypothetical protein E3N88_29783 [Mikania micrantha]|uniref:Uncharacterized protein n=1 Tax=Mikania micrantha TaxID=192012 RepID=A0A5N6MJZ7_9ASTR|nr:hypothetical protein E3N88_29783 [Mikania micrantha]
MEPRGSLGNGDAKEETEWSKQKVGKVGAISVDEEGMIRFAVLEAQGENEVMGCDSREMVKGRKSSNAVGGLGSHDPGLRIGLGLGHVSEKWLYCGPEECRRRMGMVRDGGGGDGGVGVVDFGRREKTEAAKGPEMGVCGLASLEEGSRGVKVDSFAGKNV